MRLLNILTGLPVSIPVVVQQVQPALFNQTGCRQQQRAPRRRQPRFRRRTSAPPAGVPSWCRARTSPTLWRRAFAPTPSGIPMILTDPAALSPEARQTLQDLQTQQVYIIGGTAAVSQAVQDDARSRPRKTVVLVSAVARISGADRLQTAVAIHSVGHSCSEQHHAARLDRQRRRLVTTVLLARGDTFPDSLTAAVQGRGLAVRRADRSTVASAPVLIPTSSTTASSARPASC